MGWIAGILGILVAGAAIIYYRRKSRRTIETIEHMLDRAIDGDFTESGFDESRLTALEARFARYLTASGETARKAAEEKEQIKALISDISHQTKTPVANLLLYSELLTEQQLPPAARLNAQALYQQSAKLSFLIDSLVKMSRLENGMISLTPKKGAVQPVLQAVVRQYSARAEEKGIRLCLDETEAAASFDPKWTAEALGNIVDNGIKYTEQGTVDIRTRDHEMFVRIDISDSGEGIEESEQPRVFARFYRGENAAEKDGAGVGLYLARQIISGQGGYIRLTSAPGKGSTFSVFLPK